MKIIKRNGAEETFDRQKIKDAIAKANNETDGTPELTDRQIDYISLVIEDHCNEMNRALSVEEIQELVETHIILQGAPEHRQEIYPLSLHQKPCPCLKYHRQPDIVSYRVQ